MAFAPPTIDFDDVTRAAERLQGMAHRTPVLTSRTLDALTGASVALKVEALQRGGAFKFRGAYNAVSSLPADELVRGVCAVSSGNHAQAVTLAAGLCDSRAVILMPEDAPPLKMTATRGYGAEIVTYKRYEEDREELARELALTRGLTLIHPYDNPMVMAGQGTVALELLSQVAAGLDVVVVPVGGGGLISGTATAVKALSPSTRVVGVEPAVGDDTLRSLASGQREQVEVAFTIADGQGAPTPGELTWPVIHALVEEIVTVTDEQIVDAMRFLFERMKVVAEPSGASALAALVAGVVRFDGLRVGVVISGGNIGADGFAALMAGGPDALRPA